MLEIQDQVAPRVMSVCRGLGRGKSVILCNFDREENYIGLKARGNCFLEARNYKYFLLLNGGHSCQSYFFCCQTHSHCHLDFLPPCSTMQMVLRNILSLNSPRCATTSTSQKAKQSAVIDQPGNRSRKSMLLILVIFTCRCEKKVKGDLSICSLVILSRQGGAVKLSINVGNAGEYSNSVASLRGITLSLRSSENLYISTRVERTRLTDPFATQSMRELAGLH